MIDPQTLTAELAKQVTRLEDDLRRRAETVPEVARAVEAEWQRARDAGRTAHDLATWRESLLTQVAVGWVLGTTFLRFCEDTGLLPEPLLTGPGGRARRAEDAQRAWFRLHPADGERGYVEHAFQAAAELPGLSHVFEPHNPVWTFGPSDDGVRGLLAYWREVVPETGALRRDFTDPGRSTRFLGDLYQDLSAAARKQYALLQTPEFVESFILDRTLEPAIEEFGLEGFRMIDPACGSGHFLLGAFERLLERWRRRAAQEGERALAAKALGSVYGVDLNPFAAAIARFRLLVAALQASGIRTLAEAPRFPINIAVGDSLLHGPPPGQQTFREVETADPATRHLYATEDAETIHQFLSGGYHAVVANPPYITPKDPAAAAAYRRRYKTCYRDYHLSVPFTERLFDLAIRGNNSQSAGYVTEIIDNAFMKRLFGRVLVEDYLSGLDLTHIIDTSYVPWSGIATVILQGRNRPPVSDTIRTVLGKRGEPSRLERPGSGLVWGSICALVETSGTENSYISVSDIPRVRFFVHPWSLAGGGASELKARLDTSSRTLRDFVEDSGARVLTRLDDAFELRQGTLRRARSKLGKPLLVGSDVRDWSANPSAETLFPYGGRELQPTLDPPGAKLLWPVRTHLKLRRAFGKTQVQRGLTWFEYSMIFRARFRADIVFSDTGTHNHFAVQRSGAGPSNSHAPVLALIASSALTAADVIGFANSSVACFWLKQVFHTKGAQGVDQGRKEETWQHDFELGITQLLELPLPSGSVQPYADDLVRLAESCQSNLPARIVGDGPPSRAQLVAARLNLTQSRALMVTLQEELDWRCLFLCGLTSEDLSYKGHPPPINRGERSFEIVLARKVLAGEEKTNWFLRHDCLQTSEPPSHWPEGYKRLVERRIELIENDRFVGLVERPEYKRRWNWESWEDLENEALRTWLLDRLEDRRYWPDTTPRSAAQLADVAGRDDDFRSVAELHAGTVDVDLTALVSSLVKEESVPYLAAWRYTDAGMRTRAAWERTWELQRREDAGEDVGTIPVPPKYGQADFADKASWKLRGKLDVPKERFIAYPGLNRDTDPTPLVGWAGWDHLEAARALATTYEQRRSVDGWDGPRLIPILAGLAELVPWLKQWHNDVDPATGLRLGDFFAEFVATESARNGAGPGDLAAWRPPARTAGRRRKATQ